jgi:nucleotide-binding universal stress UspA family protein
MPVSYHVTAVGVVLAVTVVAVVFGGLWWMLHPSVRAHLGLRVSPDESPTVLVPVTPGTPQEMLRLASLIAAEDNVDVTLLHVVEMPYTLPIDAQVAAAERDPGPAFLREYRRFLEETGIVVHCKVARGRRAGKAIIDWAQATRPHAIVMGAVPHTRNLLGSTTAYVMEHAGPLRVIVYKI